MILKPGHSVGRLHPLFIMVVVAIMKLSPVCMVVTYHASNLQIDGSMLPYYVTYSDEPELEDATNN